MRAGWITFIGAPASAIHAIASISESKRIMVDAGLPGYHREDQEVDLLMQETDSVIPIIGGSQVFRKLLGVDAHFEEDLLSPDPKAVTRYGKTITPIVDRDENYVDTKTGKRVSFSEEEDV